VFRISEDIETELQKKFKDIHIPTLIQYIFQSILEKSLKDGSCSIREFGKFVTYRTRSGKIGQDVVRFKFKISNTLNNKLKIDQYLLDNVPVKAKCIFTKEQEQKIKDKQDQKKANVLAQKEAERLGKNKTKSNNVTNEIENIMSNIAKNILS